MENAARTRRQTERRGQARLRRITRSAAPAIAAAGVPAIEAAKVLSFLARLAAEFATVLGLADLLDRVMQRLREEARFDSCEVALVDARDPDALTVRAASGPRDAARGKVYRRGRDPGWAVIDSGAPLIVPDLEADPRVRDRHPEHRSAILTPLLVHGSAIGVLAAYRAAPGAFTEAELNLLAVVARYLTGAVEVARLVGQRAELAATDSLTGLANRRAFLERLAAEEARSRRAGHEFSIALLDLDGFTAVNDAHGHAAGDRVLMRVAEVLAGHLRPSDVAARLGGGEFALLLPESTRAQAIEIIDPLRAAEIQVPVDDGQARVGLSWGIATWPHDGDGEHLLRAADRRLRKRPAGSARRRVVD